MKRDWWEGIFPTRFTMSTGTPEKKSNDHEIDTLLETLQFSISAYREELDAHGLDPLSSKEPRKQEYVLIPLHFCDMMTVNIVK